MKDTVFRGVRSCWIALASAACFLLSGCGGKAEETQLTHVTFVQQKSQSSSSVPLKSPLSPKSQNQITRPANIYSLSASPDGKWLCAWAEGTTKNGSHSSDYSPKTLWITAVSGQGGSAWRRVGTGISPGSWHPDSQKFVYSSVADSLKLLQLPSFRVSDFSGRGHILEQPSWSPNGNSLVAYGSDLPAQGSLETNTFGLSVLHYLAILNSQGVVTHKIKTERLPDALKVSLLNWSPDGKRVSYSSFYSLSSSVGLDVVTVATGKSTGPPHLSEGHRAVPVPWLNDKWLVLNLPKSGYAGGDGSDVRGGSATATLPAQRSYFQDGTGKDLGVIQNFLKGGNGTFYVVLGSDDAGDKGTLWRGRVTPKPHLTKKLQTLATANTAFDAPHHRLWVVGRDGQTVTAVPLR